MRLPGWLKRNLRNKEDGRDIIGIMISVRTVKRVIKWIKKRRKK